MLSTVIATCIEMRRNTGYHKITNLDTSSPNVSGKRHSMVMKQTDKQTAMRAEKQKDKQNKTKNAVYCNTNF